MDFDGDLYGKEIRIDVLKRLRGEVRFDDAEALIEQIRKDVLAPGEYLEAHGSLGLTRRPAANVASEESRCDRSTSRSSS